MEYGVNSIKVLEGLDAVRERPGMYIGSTGPAGIAQLIYEAVDNSIDEYTAGFGNEINVYVQKDGTVTVSDHGRGIPTGPHPTAKDKNGNPIDTLTLVLTTLHAGGKFKSDNDGYTIPTAGMHGVGISCCQALSDYFEAIVKRDGKIYKQTFSQGNPTSPVEVIGNTDETGTTVTYHPDKQIFKNTFRPPADVKNRFIELTSLNGGLKIVYKNDIDNFEETFFYEDGIIGYTDKMIGEHKRLFDKPVAISGECIVDKNKKFKADIVFIYDDEVESNTRIHSFANNISTIFGGYHVNGFKNALKDILNNYGLKNKLIKTPLEMKYYTDGLYATISVKVPNAEFEGQTKQKLGNEEATGWTYDIIKQYFDDNVKNTELNNILEDIVVRSIKIKEAEEAAKKARMEKRASNKVARQALPVQLADCINAGTNEYSEIILCEGNSATGAAKSGRVSTEFQAILGLRGKVLNVEKSSFEQLMNSPAIQRIIISFGTGFGKNFDIDKLRYKKIIIMTDADVDGLHIRALLITLFYRYMRPLIAEGYVYAAVPPLYRVIYNKSQSEYLKDDKALQNWKTTHSNITNYDIQRFKG